MPYLETPRELAEHMADLCGVYGAGPDGDHPDDCPCRICFVIEMQSRILASVKNAMALASKEAPCHHQYKATFQGGDTYKCQSCGKEIDITED